MFSGGRESCIETDEWWNKVFTLERYDALEKVIKECLPIFTGPMIEQSFRQE